MSRRFEELDWQETPLGELILRRRIEPTLGTDVFEVKLGEEFLMSSLFTAAEVELSRRGLGQVCEDQLDVLVGGLGLGYTAAAALEDSRVRTVTVVEALAPVVDWHRRGLLPDTAGLADDPRTRMVLGDFFELVTGDAGFGEPVPERFHAILLDIDHTPRHVLAPAHADFYTAEGLGALRRHLHPEGVFALWSDDPPDEEFLEVLSRVFTGTAAHVVEFPNPLTRGVSSNTVYVAQV